MTSIWLMQRHGRSSGRADGRRPTRTLSRTRLRRHIEAYHEAALVYAAVKLGLPDTLAAGPPTAEQLADGAWTFGACTSTASCAGSCTIGICEELPTARSRLTPGGQLL